MLSDHMQQLMEKAIDYAKPFPNSPMMIHHFAEYFSKFIIEECIEVANAHFENRQDGYPGDAIARHFEGQK